MYIIVIFDLSKTTETNKSKAEVITQSLNWTRLLETFCQVC